MTIDKLLKTTDVYTLQNKINEVIDNLGGGGTVDQTYDASSSNAQSGVAINGAKFIQNTATGTNALTIGGTPSGYTSSTNIGVSSQAKQNYGTALGFNTNANGNSSTCIGRNAGTSAASAIQIGAGINSTANTLQVGFIHASTNYQLLDGTTGLIPNERLSSDIARTSSIPTVPTVLSSFTDDLGSSPTHTHSQYLTEHQDISGKANASDLGAVAFSNSYNDLDNKPTIPSVGNGQIVFQKNGTGVGTITANQTTSTTVNFTIPTTASDVGAVSISRTINGKSLSSNITLTAADTGALSDNTTIGDGKTIFKKNGTAFATISANQTSTVNVDYTIPTIPTLATVATSGSYNDLTNKPTIPDAQVNSDWNATSGKAQILNKPTIPTVPTVLSSFTDDLGSNPTHTHSQYLTSHQDISGKADKATTLAGYGITNAYTKTEADTAISTAVAGASHLKRAIVTSLPSVAQADDNTIYMILKSPAGNTGNVYDEYFVVNDSWEKIGDTQVDLSGYVTSVNNVSPVNGNVALSIPDAQIQSDWNQTTTTAKDYIKNKPTLATVATSGSYDDLTNKPSIPSAQVNSDWNATSGISQILNKPTLSTVATSGSYADLSNKPSIPAETTEATVSGWGFTKNTGTVTSVNNVSPVNGNVSITIPTVPTVISAFTNDAGYLTEHQSLSGYVPTSRTVNGKALSGNISLTASDVGAITGISSSDVTTALGYTPYNSSNPNGYTSNTGTITGITMNGSSKGTSGVVDLGTVITAHQDISGKVNISDIATSVSASSTNTVPVGAKLFYDTVGNIESALNTINSGV